MARLLACRFCRQLFSEGEADQCPECGVELERLERLPPSLDALAEQAEQDAATPPEHRTLPAGFLGRGRGALLALAVLGLVLFFLPWVRMTQPELVTISGYQLARGRAGWLWGGAIGWFLMLPLVFTRRTIAKMRGARVIIAAFAAMTAIEVAMLIALPPQGHRYLRVEFEWGWALYASGVVSLLAIAVAIRFGGRPPADAPAEAAEPVHDLPPPSSDEPRVLH
ncbi:MAG TPA: zinc ribbon domain-containing protein [Polyangiaceae bacterium]|nr:zinc ribbon domain-containing protein [Polyangiaceae bacterium]